MTKRLLVTLKYSKDGNHIIKTRPLSKHISVDEVLSMVSAMISGAMQLAGYSLEETLNTLRIHCKEQSIDRSTI